MTYEELVKEVKKNYGALDASNIKEHVAVQFNIEGEAEGAFYVEIADSNVDVEPFEYYDRDAVVTTKRRWRQMVCLPHRHWSSWACRSRSRWRPVCG